MRCVRPLPQPGRRLSLQRRLTSAELQLAAAETARNGLYEEWRMGDRTMREFLDAEQDVLAARINLVTVQRERVLATYSVAQAAGRLTLAALSNIKLNAMDSSLNRIALRSSTHPRVQATPRSAECGRECVHAFGQWALRD